MLRSARTIALWAILPAALILPAAGGAQEGRVEIAPRESGSYQARLPDQDELRWSANWTLEQTEEGPPARYTVRDELRGKFGADDQEQTRITRADFLLDRGEILMQQSRLIVKNPQGETVFILEKNFDYSSRVVRTRAQYPLEKKTEDDEFEMGDRLVDNKEIVSFLRGFPFPPPGAEAEEKDRYLEFKFLNEEPDTYSVLVEYEGIEEVQTPAGSFSCHRLRLVPDLGIFTFLGRMLAPDIQMWFTVAAPHFWVKYRGLEGDLDTPGIISQLVEFNSSQLEAGE